MNIEDEIKNLRVIKFPHPTLRRKSKPIVKVDRHLRSIVTRMFELMYEHRGIGLAANQVDLPFQLFVINLEAEPGRGKEQVFVNPVLELPKGNKEAEEGCLSLPDVYGKIVRPEQVHVKAYGIDGSEFKQTVDGLLARVIQHEFDHLQGVMFPDRMTDGARKAIEEDLANFGSEYEAEVRQGHVGTEQEIENRLQALEKLYCGT